MLLTDMLTILLITSPLEISDLYKNLFATDDEAIKNVVKLYFVLRYKSQMSFETVDFSAIAATDKPENAERFLREQRRQKIQQAIVETFRLEWEWYQFEIEFMDIKIDVDNAEFILTENRWIQYASASAPSGMANLTHRIVLKKVNGQWLIINDTYRNDLTDAMEILTDEQILKNIQQNYEAQFSQLSETQPQEISQTGDDSLSSGIQQVTPTPTLTWYAYNRSLAVSYADTWAFRRNPTYHDETTYGDCTNFASQAIYEGTNKTMSDPPGYMTRWYYDFYTHTGSYPWVNVGGLNDFLTSNTGKGPYGISTTLCGLSVGDVIVMKLSDQWKHTVIVTAIEDCRDANRIYVNSHDAEVCRDPLSTFPYSWFPIRISGYRK